MTATTSSGPIRVGVIGCGEVSQVIHLPTLALMPHLFKVTAACDISAPLLKHVCSKFHIPHAFSSEAELCRSAKVDVVLVASADEFHHVHAERAAENGKHVFIEKPMTLTRERSLRLEELRKKHNVHISVGYMRRYAPAFQVFKDLLSSSGPIQYAVVRDLIGPNSLFVSQSGTYAAKPSEIPEARSREKLVETDKLATEALGEQAARDERLVFIYRLLGSLGSHDLSLMREALGGVPRRCESAFANKAGDFISAHFVYAQEGGEEFAVSYETGIHNVGVFDAFIEVFTRDRVIKIQYDTPYVKGLPITINVREAEPGLEGSYMEKTIRPTFTDAYTAEWEALAAALREGKEMKTGPMDAVLDFDVFDAIMQKLM